MTEAITLDEYEILVMETALNMAHSAALPVGGEVIKTLLARIQAANIQRIIHEQDTIAFTVDEMEHATIEVLLKGMLSSITQQLDYESKSEEYAKIKKSAEGIVQRIT
ncbi:hypothetical protein ACQPZP_41055 [Spirillospora sp. CA-142024]|uniref:hypothetical protein n=1 Tax=Spirillospora sp. CA-142024 TaxID=3240036 RepID=UPI003D8C2091